MEIQIDNNVKARIAKYGPNKLFGDYKERQELRKEELTRRFDNVWKKGLGAAISQAEPSRATKESLEMQLTPREGEYFDDSQEHRLFTVDNEGLRFIAQLKVDEDQNQGRLTQLWDISPKRSRLQPKELSDRLTKKQREAQAWSEIYYKSGFWRRMVYLAIGVPVTILAILTGSSYFSNLYGERVVGALSLIIGTLTALQTFLDLGRQSEKLEAAGKGWGKLAREIEKQIIRLETTQIDPEDELNILDDVVQQMNALQEFSPTIGPKEYEKAKRKLEQEPQAVPDDKTHRSHRPRRRTSTIYTFFRSKWCSWFVHNPLHSFKHIDWSLDKFGK
jgi:hypothetical protein